MVPHDTQEMRDLLHGSGAERPLALWTEQQALAKSTVSEQDLVMVQKYMQIGHVPGRLICSDPVHANQVLGSHQHLIGFEHATCDARANQNPVLWRHIKIVFRDIWTERAGRDEDRSQFRIAQHGGNRHRPSSNPTDGLCAPIECLDIVADLEGFDGDIRPVAKPDLRSSAETNNIYIVVPS